MAIRSWIHWFAAAWIRLVSRHQINAEPALALGRQSNDLECDRFARFDQRSAHADCHDAIALVSAVLDHEIAHLDFAVGAVPGLIVKGNAEIEHRFAVEPQRESS